MSTNRRFDALRAAVADLGPLRWVVLASAVLPTTGMLLVFASLPMLAFHWNLSQVGAYVAGAAIALTTALLLLPPSMAALAAGYVFGSQTGALVAAGGIAIGGLLGSRVVWPLVGVRLFGFMQGRPRLEGVRRFCAVPIVPAIGRVAVVRAAARVPFSVVNLLLSAARVPALPLLLGTAIAAVPMAVVASCLGAALRGWRERQELPAAGGAVSLGIAAAVAVAAMVAARRRFRAAGN